MKKTLLSMTLLLAALGMQAKDIKTLVVTTMPQMHCDNCQTKIKGNLRFEKGVKNIETNIEEQRVTITYDADKTNPESLIKAFDKFGYKATQLQEEQQKETPKQDEKKK